MPFNFFSLENATKNDTVTGSCSSRLNGSDTYLVNHKTRSKVDAALNATIAAAMALAWHYLQGVMCNKNLFVSAYFIQHVVLLVISWFSDLQDMIHIMICNKYLEIF